MNVSTGPDLTRRFMRGNILLVEDEEAIRMVLSDRLRKEGYVVDFAADGDSGFEKAMTLPFDLIFLDIMLPGRSGLDLCRDIRIAGLGTPILILTARAETPDKVAGLKLGADDYVTKPFDMTELIARTEALLRRAPSRARVGTGVYQFGSLLIETRFASGQGDTIITRSGEPVYLSSREFDLLRYFMEHPGITLSREILLREVWGYEEGTFTRTVDMHVASLRQKLEKDAKRPELILTVHKMGYKFAGRRKLRRFGLGCWCDHKSP
jgi:two-component system alkaline phosphatase synthesis response regulator PhoP